MLKNSHSVIITPGYGMAVAQAQYPVAEITEKLRARVGSRFALVFTRWRDVCQAT
jgi:NAD/NADP transhydrogenase beta subunit